MGEPRGDGFKDHTREWTNATKVEVSIFYDARTYRLVGLKLTAAEVSVGDHAVVSLSIDSQRQYGETFDVTKALQAGPNRIRLALRTFPEKTHGLILLILDGKVRDVLSCGKPAGPSIQEHPLWPSGVTPPEQNLANETCTKEVVVNLQP